MERLKRLGMVAPRTTPPTWMVRPDPQWTAEEEAIEFGQILERVAANDPHLNNVTSHEVCSSHKLCDVMCLEILGGMEE